MTLSFIVAVSDNNAIGRDNALPWNLPDDMKFFKRTTMGKPVIMGRKTFEALGKPLPGRLNIVLSKNENYVVPEGVVRVSWLHEAMIAAKDENYKNNKDEIFIIGGAKVFSKIILLADRLYITRVHAQIPDADAFFPVIDHTHFKLVWEEAHEKDENHIYSFTFQQYESIEL